MNPFEERAGEQKDQYSDTRNPEWPKQAVRPPLQRKAVLAHGEADVPV